MNCPNCLAKVDQGAKFCRQCGGRIGIECPTCGAPNPADSKYCGNCGGRMTELKKDPPGVSDRIVDAPAPSVVRHGERRHVTILFTDLTGYTSLTEKHDPEDIQAMMSAVQSKVSEIILKYHGNVERVSVTAYWRFSGCPRPTKTILYAPSKRPGKSTKPLPP